VKEYDSEPVPGLPEQLPEGERILWQGRPDWMALSQSAFHIRAVAIYFALLAAWFAGSELSAGGTAYEAARAATGVVPGAVVAISLLAGIAALSARAALYTITTQRVVMRFGMALPMILNIPYKQIASADLKLHRDGTGDIPLMVTGGKRQSMVVLWPHVRPWRATEPQPMLRCIPDARNVADVLASALRSQFPDAAVAVAPVENPVPGGSGADAGHGHVAA
jgi:hypothetical protein